MVRVRVTGLRELERDLNKIDKAVAARTPARNALKKGGQILADTASRMAPDDPETGGNDLRNSIVVSTRTSRGTRKLLAGAGMLSKRQVNVFVGPTTKIFYAHFMEFGTYKDAAQPYMRPAWDATRMDVLDKIVDELRVQVKKAVARSQKRGLKRLLG